MRKRKNQKHFIYEGCGFPVHLLNVPMVYVRDVWAPELDYNKLDLSILQILAFKPARLTGKEIYFIRHYFEMTTTQFAARFDVSFAAVLKWEKSGDRPTKMNWTTEKDVRLFIIKHTINKPKVLDALYEKLETVSETKKSEIKIDVQEQAAAA